MFGPCCLCVGVWAWLFRGQVKLEFPAASTPGTHDYTLYFMCDSYMGCDQEYEFQLNVGDGDAGME